MCDFWSFHVNFYPFLVILGSFLIFVFVIVCYFGSVNLVLISLAHLEYLPKQFRPFWGHFGQFRYVLGYYLHPFEIRSAAKRGPSKFDVIIWEGREVL